MWVFPIPHVTRCFTEYCGCAVEAADPEVCRGIDMAAQAEVYVWQHGPQLQHPRICPPHTIPNITVTQPVTSQ